jgi:hypothetical protein
MFGDYSVLSISLVVVMDFLVACALASSCWKLPILSVFIC